MNETPLPCREPLVYIWENTVTHLLLHLLYSICIWSHLINKVLGSEEMGLLLIYLVQTAFECTYKKVIYTFLQEKCDKALYEAVDYSP